MNGWSPEPSVLVGSLLLAGGYLLCVGPWRGRFPGSEPVSAGRALAFLLGVATIVLALGTPIDTLSDQYLFSVHMVQHMLLTLIMPPLLLLGTPGWLVRPLLRSWLAAGLLRFLTQPLVAFLVFNVVLVFSHFPTIYNSALEDHRLHVVQHLVYMGAAVLAWWPILSPLPELPRLSYPLQMLYLFLMTIPGALLGAILSLADSVLYPVYAAAPRVTSLTPQQDQQLGGLIMWLGAPLYTFGIMTVIFFVWASQEDVQSLTPSPRGR